MAENNQHGGARPGAGRKKVSPEDKQASKTVSLPPWMWDRLDAIKGSRSGVIKASLLEYLK